LPGLFVKNWLFAGAAMSSSSSGVIQMLEERVIPFEKLISEIYPMSETPVN
jgi:hypothetical protein